MPMPRDANGFVIQCSPNWVNTPNIAITASSTQSATFAATTTAVRLCPTTDCWISLGTNPTASAATGGFMAGGSVEFIAVEVGQSWKVAVIQNTAGGTLSISEVS